MPILKRYGYIRLAVMAWACVMGLATWGGGGIWLWRDYHQTIQSAEGELSRISLAAAEHVRRLVSLTDVLFDSLERAIPLGGNIDDLAAHSGVGEQVRRLLSQADGILDVVLVGHTGQMLLLPPAPIRKALTEADRAYGDDARMGGVSIIAPIMDRSSGLWIIPISRRISDPAKPVAILHAGIHLSALEDVYGRLHRGRGGAIALFRADGILLARAPHMEEALGTSIADGYVFKTRISQASEGGYVTVSRLDGVERLGYFRTVEPQGLVVLVSQSMSEVLAPWRRQLVLVGGAVAIITLMTVVGALLLNRYLDTLESGAVSLDRRVKERTSELQSLMEARSKFLTSISHELRTPLNAVIGFSDALMAGVFGPVPVRQEDYLRDINRSGHHLLALVNDLLDSAAVDAGKLHLDESEFDLGDVVDEAMSMVRQRAVAMELDMFATVEPSSLRLRADRRRLVQALLNLCSNAVKYNRKGGKVEIRARLKQNGQCVIVVIDNGIGMNAEDMALAMAPFGRASDPSIRAIEGTGLGLPLTVNIIELHGGSLMMDSAPGFGTTMGIVLPASRVIPMVSPTLPALALA